MKKIKLQLIFAVVLCAASTNAMLAQGGKGVKPDSGQTKVEKFDPQDLKKFDPKRLFDERKISRQLQNASDVFVKDAILVWQEVPPYNDIKGKTLIVIPILGKNSKTAQIYARDKKGQLEYLRMTVEWLDKNGTALATCNIDWDGWTNEGTEAKFGVCSSILWFVDGLPSTKNIFDRIRINADVDNLLNEVNKKNNVLLTKIPDFNESKEKLASELP